MTEPLKKHPASGIEALIEQLREQGVERGQKEAARIIEDAEKEAELLLHQAQEEADALRKQVHRDIARQKQAGEDALKMAARDLLLEVKENLARSFTDQVERLIEQQMNKDEFMQRLIIELVGRVRDQSGLSTADQMEVLLPETAVGLDELRRNANEYQQGHLSQFVQALTAEVLREGVVFKGHSEQGIRIRLIGQEVEVDLTQQAIAQLLLRHLQPRFRALLEGVIR
ncbi:MAG: ATPase [Saccharospirillum sp.]